MYINIYEGNMLNNSTTSLSHGISNGLWIGIIIGFNIYE